MAKVANLPYRNASEQCFCGIIKGKSEQQWIVDTGLGVVTAKTAFSCLVKPQINDQVMIACDSNDYYILAITAREVTSQLEVNFGDLVSASISEGNLSLDCEDTFTIQTKATELSSRTVKVTATDSQLLSHKVTVVGDDLSTKFNSVKRFANNVLDICETVTRKLTHCFKHVDGLEQHQSRDSIQSVKNSLTMRSHHANITARKEMKIDGERIHMG